VFRLAEPADHAAFGVPPATVPDLPPGRALSPDGPTLVHIARPTGGLAAAVARIAGGREGRDRIASPDISRATAAPIRALPSSLRLDEAARWTPGTGAGPCGPNARPTRAQAGPQGLDLAIGVSDAGLAVARLVVAPGGHALVAGPPRSGRTTALATIAAAAVAAGHRAVLVAPGTDLPAAASTAPGVAIRHVDDPDLAALIDGGGPIVVLVDDVERIDPGHPVLAGIVADRRGDRHVVAAGRSDRIRSLYAHWVQEVRVDRCGILLRPDPDLDGDLLGVRLPHRPPVPPAPGRGWLAGKPDGFVQVALPPTEPAWHSH
jgi:S-DNA-T family DNA segregation ATPase FtsK/SpoIIIE